MTEHNLPEGATLATLDLGSNSFHLLLARNIKGEISMLKKMGEKVQLAAGLDEDGWLSSEAQQRGWDCLSRMAPFLQGLAENQVRIVATNALRAARNAQDFIKPAEEILGFPIEVVAGREEARLIFSGVVHTSPKIEGRRLVVDIGGGSTEFIIGQDMEPQLLESLHMGCVSYTHRYLGNPEVTEKRYQKARLAALSQLSHIQRCFRQRGWQLAQGCSGTLKAIAQLVGKGESQPITPTGISRLEKELFKAKTPQVWADYGLKPERLPMIPAGLAITSAFFEALNIQEMHYADSALREGVLYELLGSPGEEDIRKRTVRALIERFQIDTQQSQLVTQTALHALNQVEKAWNLQAPKWRNKLQWAAELHEIGLSVAHTQYHKHGAYLMHYADLPGFTHQQQQLVAALIRTHRRKFSLNELQTGTAREQLLLQRLARLLRLAVLFHHSRPDTAFMNFTLSASTGNGDPLLLAFPAGFLADQPLLRADLEQEAAWQQAAGFELSIQDDAETL